MLTFYQELLNVKILKNWDSPLVKVKMVSETVLDVILKSLVQKKTELGQIDGSLALQIEQINNKFFMKPKGFSGKLRQSLVDSEPLQKRKISYEMREEIQKSYLSHISINQSKPSSKIPPISIDKSELTRIKSESVSSEDMKLIMKSLLLLVNNLPSSKMKILQLSSDEDVSLEKELQLLISHMDYEHPDKYLNAILRA